MWLCIGLIGLAMLTRLWILQSVAPSSWSSMWLNTFARLDPIAIGALIALSWSRYPLALPARVRSGTLLTSAIAMAALQWKWPVFPTLHSSAVWVYFVAAVIMGAVVLVTVSTPLGYLSLPALVYLGRISYGLYVIHFPVIVALKSLSLAAVWRAPLAILLTVGIAALSYRFLEEPFLRLKDRFT